MSAVARWRDVRKTEYINETKRGQGKGDGGREID